MITNLKVQFDRRLGDRWALRVHHTHLCGDLLRDAAERRRLLGVGLVRHGRLAGVAAFTDRRIEIDAAEERHAQLLGGQLSASDAEHLACHVLHDAQHWHLHAA